MDTTTVNFAINKLSEGWQKVAPTIADVGEKYVQYLVTKTVVENVLMLIAGVALLLLTVGLVYFGFKKDGFVYKNDLEPIFGMSGLVVGVFGAICLMLGVLSIPDTILALTNPEMFTVHHLIESAKK